MWLIVINLSVVVVCWKKILPCFINLSYGIHYKRSLSVIHALFSITMYISISFRWLNHHINFVCFQYLGKMINLPDNFQNMYDMWNIKYYFIPIFIYVWICQTAIGLNYYFYFALQTLHNLVIWFVETNYKITLSLFLKFLLW